MAKQLFKEGDTIKQGNVELECVLVQYRERDGQFENFVYGFRAKSELDAERASEKKVKDDQEASRISKGGKK